MRHATRGKSNQCLNMCTYNTHTINDLNVHARDTMLHEISDMNWDIIGLSETKEKETKIEPLKCGNQLIGPPPPALGIYGFTSVRLSVRLFVLDLKIRS